MFLISDATPADFAEILALQEENHLSVLPDEARSDGFLTTYLTPESLEELRAIGGIVVARAQNGEFAGFAGAQNWDVSGERSFHRGFLELLPLSLDGEHITAANSFQYGPACVAGQFRGQGVLPVLLGRISANFAARCDYGITFIDHRNARSLAAHERKLGLQIVADYPFDTTIYRVLAFKIRAFL